MSKIILKHSDGVDKEPLIADLAIGEVAVNTVTGTMYQILDTPQGQIIGSTDFNNVYNSTPQPSFTLSATANEGAVVDINILNYNSSNIYSINITGGAIDTSINPFEWTMPLVSDLTTHGISISSRAPNKVESSPTPFQYINVSNISGIVDDAVIMDSQNIDNALFDTLTNATTVLGTVATTADDIVAETINFEQEAEDNDWQSSKHSVQIHHRDIIKSDSNQLLSKIQIDNDVNINVGDSVYVKQEGFVKETQVNGVDSTELNFPIKAASCYESTVCFLAQDGTIKFFGTYPLADSLTDVKKIEVGLNFAMAILENNALYVIGENSNGQLGLGDTTTRTSWTDAGLTVLDIAVGEKSSYLIKTDGTLHSTGFNNDGRLGLNNTNSQTTWTDTGITQGSKVYSGYDYAAIIKEDGSFWTCGANSAGQLALGDTSERHIFTNTGVLAIQATLGNLSTYIIKPDGSLWACGYNHKGQLGFGDTDSTRYSLTNTGIINARYMVSGEYSAVLIKTDNSVWTTGLNTEGQLGLGDTTDRTSFTDTGDLSSTGSTTELSTLKNLSAYNIDINERVYGTGLNSSGELDTGDIIDRDEFQLTRTSSNYNKYLSDFIPPLHDGIEFEEFEIHHTVNTMGIHTNSMKIDPSGRLWARGANADGQLGLGDTTTRNVWTDTGVTEVKSVAIGDTHTIIVKEDGTVWGTGDNYRGQLGLGNTTDRTSFEMAAITGAKEVSCGDGFTIIIKNDGTVWGTGYNTKGQLGLGTNTNTYTFNAAILDEEVIHVACGAEHSFVILRSGQLLATGKNNYGQLGFDDTTDRVLFTKTGINALHVQSYSQHSLLVKSDGSLWGTGSNSNKQLGLGDTTQRIIWTDTGITGVSKVTTGDYHSVILKADGSVWSCGDNAYGQLGLGGTTDATYFTDTGEVAVNIQAAAYNSLIELSDGTHKCSGTNPNNTISDTSGNILAFNYMTPDEDLHLESIDTYTTAPGEQSIPTAMYQKSLQVETSLEATSTKVFTFDTLNGIPVSTTNGLGYNFTQVSKIGTFSSTRITGLKEQEYITYIKTELET